MSTPHAARFDVRRPRINLWLVAVVGLVAALVGMGVWMFLDRETSTSEGFASGAVVTMLDARLAALNSGGKQPLARFYSRDAVQEEFDVVPPIVIKGGEEVAGHNEGYSRLWALQDLQVTRESAVIQVGDYVAYATRLGDDLDGIAVFKLDPNGKIVHQWFVATPGG